MLCLDEFSILKFFYWQRKNKINGIMKLSQSIYKSNLYLQKEMQVLRYFKKNN